MKGRASTRNQPSNTDVLYTIESQKRRYNETTITLLVVFYSDLYDVWHTF